MEGLIDSGRRRSRAVTELETWAARARKSQSPAQAAASAALTDEEVNRMVHETRNPTAS